MVREKRSRRTGGTCVERREVKVLVVAGRVGRRAVVNRVGRCGCRKTEKERSRIANSSRFGARRERGNTHSVGRVPGSGPGRCSADVGHPKATSSGAFAVRDPKFSRPWACAFGVLVRPLPRVYRRKVR